ncbi:hypothetical protein VDGL01_08314 [Verticillium dahliae]
MAILADSRGITAFRGTSPEGTIDDLGVFIIGGDDTDGTDEECEFEDVLGVDTTASMVNHTQPEAEEDADDDDDGDVHDDAVTDAQDDTNADAPTPRVEHHWKSDKNVTPDVTPRDDTIKGPGSVVDDDGDDDSTVRLDHNGVAAGTSSTIELDPKVIVEVSNTVRGLAVEVATLRNRLAEVEAQLHPGSVACQSTRPSKKRKRSTPTSRRRVKVGRTVNISAKRAYRYWNDSSEFSTYTWRRGRGGYCWVSDVGGEKGEEIDGEYLLCYGTSISIEVTANADWLPIELRFNDDTQMFEGQASLGKRRLGVDCSVVMDMMRGGKGEHVASVSYT